MTDGLFREECLTHQSERFWGKASGLNLPNGAMITTLLLVIAGVVSWFLITGSYTRKESVSGLLVSDKGAAQIRAPGEGVVDALLIRQGERVGKGDLLLTLKMGKTVESGESLQNQLLAENSAQSSLFTDMIRRRGEAWNSRLLQLQAERQRLENRAALLAERLEDEKEVTGLIRNKLKNLEVLNGKGMVADSTLEAAKIDLLRQQSSLARARQEYSDNRSELQGLGENRRLMAMEHRERTSELKQALSRLQQQALEIRSSRTLSLVSPVTGTIAVVFKQPGQSVSPGQPLVSLIQEGASLEAELFVPARAAGFLDVGLPVSFRFNAFPYQKFGIQTGRVREVSRALVLPGDMHDAIRVNEPVFRARAVLDHQQIQAYGQGFALRQGMDFQADILLEERSLLQWLLAPLYSLRKR